MPNDLTTRSARWILALGALVAFGCGDDDGGGTNGDMGSVDGGLADGGTADAGGTSGTITFPDCPSDIWAGLADYDDVGELADCPADEPVAASLLQLGGVTIDNNGETMTPCVAALCDATYVYVATNRLPHYDFVQTTPNALVEQLTVVRIPRDPTPLGENAAATDAAAADGCIDGYEQHVVTPGDATAQEPSGLCANAGDVALFEALADGRVDYQAIPCLGGFGFLISGAPVFGPNEAGFPDPWGNPGATAPETAADALGALDLCGGHTANEMHYHYVAEACFERDAGSGAPATSYVEAAERWDLAEELNGECLAESPIVGWSYDGYPIKGPCVCMTRDASGACTELRRATSSWTYEGLGSWEGASGLASEGALDLEGMACTTNADCPDNDYRCTWALNAGDGGVTSSKQCVLIDYGWCGNRYAERAEVAGRVFLDRCNGTLGADGYAYHTTASFPHIQGCYRGVPATQAGGGGGMMGGGMVMDCTDEVTERCCGDGVCGGPETDANCPEDCS
ncbi:MAG: YHYH protein [Myxococcota bacterium]